MSDRGGSLVPWLVVVVVLAVGAFSFMFAMWLEMDEKEQFIAKADERLNELREKRDSLQATLNARTTDLEKAQEELTSAKDRLEEVKRWRDEALENSRREERLIKPAVTELDNTKKALHSELRSVDEARKESMSAFEVEKRSLEEAIRVAHERLQAAVRDFEQREHAIDDEIGQLMAKLAELRARLHKARAQALRRDTISDAGGKVISVGDPSTNFVVVNLGTVDRVRPGMKFKIWSLRRGYGLGWVKEKGRDFVDEGVLPGDWLVAGREPEVDRYPIVTVGIAREAEEKGLGLTRRAGNDTLKIVGPGVTESYSVAGKEWRVETATAMMPPEEIGAEVKGMIEVVEVRAHTSDCVILPERHKNPVCPQCGWEAYEPDMKYCVYCYLGDDDNEVQPLDQSVKKLLNVAPDRFEPIMPGDRLSNPLFMPNFPLIFVIGSKPVERSRQEMKAVIEANGGRVVPPENLLKRPEVAAGEVTVREIMAYEINYLIPGDGPDSEPLLKRARELGVRVMREDELFEFFGEVE
jgi:hypothetical protein